MAPNATSIFASAVPGAINPEAMFPTRAGVGTMVISIDVNFKPKRWIV
jgi:hypothetical protein